MAQTHSYPVSVTWTGGREGGGTATCKGSGTELTLSVGKEYGGPGQGTNPEELLSASIAACYAITFGIIAANRKLPVTSLHLNAEGQVDQSGMQFVYSRIALRPRITLDANSTEEQLALAKDMAHKAEQYCIITAAVKGKVEVLLEPEIVRG
jgi:peroxiredoxin-like protein